MPIVPEVHPRNGGNNRYRPQHRYLLTRHEAADYIGVSVSALAHWPAQHRGPKQRIIGRSAYYDVRDLDDWLATRASRRGGR